MAPAASILTPYWHGAGSIWRLSNPADQTSAAVEIHWQDAVDLCGYLSRAAAECAGRMDREGGRYCARQAIALLKAIEAFDDWQCAVSGTARDKSPLAEFRALRAADVPRAA